MTDFCNSPDFIAFSKRCKDILAPGHWYCTHMRNGVWSRFSVVRAVTHAQHDPTYDYTDAFLIAGVQAVEYDRLLYDVIAPAFARRRK